MENPTIKEIDSIIKELGEAMTEMCLLDKADTEIKTAKIKAQKRLSLARESIRSIKWN